MVTKVLDMVGWACISLIIAIVMMATIIFSGAMFQAYHTNNVSYFQIRDADIPSPGVSHLYRDKAIDNDNDRALYDLLVENIEANNIYYPQGNFVDDNAYTAHFSEPETKEAYKPFIVHTNLDTTNIRDIWNMIMCDNPYYSVLFKFHITMTGPDLFVLTASQNMSWEKYQSQVAEIEKEIDEIFETYYTKDTYKFIRDAYAHCTDGLGDRELTGTYPNDVYSAMIERDSYCFGRAHVMKLLFDRANIENFICLGDVNDYHASNAVKIDGTWYYMDLAPSPLDGDILFNILKSMPAGEFLLFDKFLVNLDSERNDFIVRNISMQMFR